MAYIANQRIKVGGELYQVGDLVDLTEEVLAELPPGAVSPMEKVEPDASGRKSGQEKQPDDADGKAVALEAAVADLDERDFKQDGNIRADSLRRLAEKLGFDITAEDVADAKSAAGAAE